MSEPSAPTRTRRRYLPRGVCLAVIFIALPLLLWLEMGKPTLTEDPVLAPLVTMTLTRGLGAAVFLALLLHEGYRVVHPFPKLRKGALAVLILPMLVVINNAPLLSLAQGDAYLIHTAPVYLVWFGLECLAIGLFEELAFRGVIFLMFAERRYASRRGLFWSLILTSAVFGGVHLINALLGGGIGGVILQIGYSFLIGAMCSVVLLKTRNIWFCVLLHAVYDFCGNLLPTLGGGTWWDTPTVVFTAILAVVTTAYLVWQFFTLDLSLVGEIYRDPVFDMKKVHDSMDEKPKEG